MIERALSKIALRSLGCRPVQVLNFYSTVFADQMKRGRKTATIRLGDKRHKYRKNQVVLVTVGYQYSPREKLFHAVIDNVEVKRVKDLSPRDIEHDNPEFRRTEELVHFLEQIYGREVVARGHGHRRPLLADRREPAGLPGPPARRRRRAELAFSCSWSPRRRRVRVRASRRTRRRSSPVRARARRRGREPDRGRHAGRRQRRLGVRRRVERTLKGAAAERVTLRSGITSCQITLAVGQRVGLTHIGADLAGLLSSQLRRPRRAARGERAARAKRNARVHRRHRWRPRHRHRAARRARSGGGVRLPAG